MMMVMVMVMMMMFSLSSEVAPLRNWQLCVLVAPPSEFQTLQTLQTLLQTLKHGKLIFARISHVLGWRRRKTHFEWAQWQTHINRCLLLQTVSWTRSSMRSRSLFNLINVKTLWLKHGDAQVVSVRYILVKIQKGQWQGVWDTIIFKTYNSLTSSGFNWMNIVEISF